MSGSTVLVNGHQNDAEVSCDSRPKSTRKVSGRRKQAGTDETVGRRTSRGRQVAERVVNRLSTAASLAAAWRHPTSSSSELAASAADDSGFASTGRRAGSNVASPDKTTSDAMSSSPVDWLDVDRVPAGRVPGATGIINHHNTCFINAIIQCLSNTPAFVIRALDPLSSVTFQDGQLMQPQSTTNCKLGKELSRLLRAMWTGRYSMDSSKAFHRAVRRLANGWYGGEEQNDAHEFAAWLLNRLRDEQFGACSNVNGYPRSPAVDSVKQTVRSSISYLFESFGSRSRSQQTLVAYFITFSKRLCFPPLYDH